MTVIVEVCVGVKYLSFSVEILSMFLFFVFYCVNLSISCSTNQTFERHITQKLSIWFSSDHRIRMFFFFPPVTSVTQTAKPGSRERQTKEIKFTIKYFGFFSTQSTIQTSAPGLLWSLETKLSVRFQVHKRDAMIQQCNRGL